MLMELNWQACGEVRLKGWEPLTYCVSTSQVLLSQLLWCSEHFHSNHTTAYQTLCMLCTQMTGSLFLPCKCVQGCCRQMYCTITVILSFRGAHVHTYTRFPVPAQTVAVPRTARSNLRQHGDTETNTQHGNYPPSLAKWGETQLLS